jgi:hypothetical protein
MVLRSHLQAKALVRQATIVPLALHRLVSLNKPGMALPYLHLLVHPPIMAALLHPLCESLTTVTSLHYTPKPTPVPYQHTPSTLQSCSLVVCRWVHPHPPKALGHHHPTDSQNTAPTARLHHTTTTYPEIVFHHLANACSRVPTHHSLLPPSCNNNSAQPPTHPPNNLALRPRMPTPSIPPPPTLLPTLTRTPLTSPLPQQQQTSSAPALTCKARLCHPSLPVPLLSSPQNTIHHVPDLEIVLLRRRLCRLLPH